MATTEDVRATLEILASYGGRAPEFTESFVELWAGSLRYAEPEVLGGAAKQWVENMPAFPKLSEFRSEVRNYRARWLAGRGMSLGRAQEDVDVTPPSEYPARVRALRRQLATVQGPLFSGIEERVV